jgi:hypothetical protein
MLVGAFGEVNFGMKLSAREIFLNTKRNRQKLSMRLKRQTIIFSER